MITQTNYSKTSISHLTQVLPRGSKQKVAETTGENYTTVDNVWSGKQYKKNVVDAIVKLYKRTIKEHSEELS